MAADHAEELGVHDAIELVMLNIEGNPQSQAAQGSRTLINLVQHDGNKIRARDLNISSRMKIVMEALPDDGTLQWRGSQVLDLIKD